MTTDDRGYEIPADWHVFGAHAGLTPVPDLEFSKQKDETGEPLFERRVCPDKGVCWHKCFDRPCFRVTSCAPFTAYGEDWTDEDKRANGVEVKSEMVMVSKAVLKALVEEAMSLAYIVTSDRAVGDEPGAEDAIIDLTAALRVEGLLDAEG